MEKLYYRFMTDLLWFERVTIPRLFLNFDEIVYKLIEAFDPEPKGGRKETVDDWLKRVPLKYALRHSKYRYHKWTGMLKDITVREIFLDKKSLPKDQKEFLTIYKDIMVKLQRVASENYQKVLLRQRLESMPTTN